MAYEKKVYNKLWRDTHKIERAIYQKEYSKNYRINHRDKYKESQKKWAIENRDKIYLYRKAHPEWAKMGAERWYSKNKERIRAEQRIYNQAHKKEAALRTKNRRANDVEFYLAHILRARLSNALKKDTKNGSFVKDLGCSIKELKFYLEGKFQDGMSWENRGLHGWHIDHVIPLAFFDLTDREQFLRACHYTNLQPLWAVDNIRKGARVVLP